jgi:hypothetical protein
VIQTTSHAIRNGRPSAAGLSHLSQPTCFRSSCRAARVLALVIAVLSFAGNAGLVAQDSELRFGSGVPRDVELMYERGLTWLAENQTPAGHWGAAASGSGTHGVEGAGITGMGVMAFVASGEDPNFGKYSENIRRAVRSMILSQNPETGFLPSSMYHHGFAMLGLAEVYGVLDEQDLWPQGTPPAEQRTIGESLELAVRCAITSQKRNPYQAWRYSPDARDADTSVSGAVLMGLLAARNAGISVPDESIDQAMEYFLSMTSADGDVGYSGIGHGGSWNLKAISGLVLAIGKRKDAPQYAGVLRQLASNLEHTERSYTQYYRYYTAQSLFQGDFEAWIKWNQKTIRDLQQIQADDGSFDSQFGRPYGTSMSLLSLALNYRLLPVYER